MRVRYLMVLWTLACGYRAGSFVDRFETFGDERASVGCVDVSVERILDPHTDGPAVRVTFANRCEAAVEVDLSAIRATGRFADGEERPLTVRDPDSDVAPAWIDALTAAHETLEYETPAEAVGEIERLCLDVARIDAEEPEPLARRLCVSYAVPADLTPHGTDECVETTDVVGRARCTRYGNRWALEMHVPPVQVRGGMSYRRFVMPQLRFGSGEEVDYHAAGPDRGVASASTVDARIAVADSSFHIGVEGSFALRRIEGETVTAGTTTAQLSGGVYASGALVTGVSIRSGFAVGRVEVLAGARWIDLDLSTMGTDGSSSFSSGAWQGLLQPRVSMELLLSPWATLGLYVGTDLLDGREAAVGLFLEGHTRAFDMSRPRAWDD